MVYLVPPLAAGPAHGLRVVRVQHVGGLPPPRVVPAVPHQPGRLPRAQPRAAPATQRGRRAQGGHQVIYTTQMSFNVAFPLYI